MKIQHTSGAVIEVDDNAVFEEDATDIYVNEVSGRRSRYAKPDWQRVPEERWEKVILEVEKNSTSAYLRLPNHDRSRIGMVELPRLPKLRYRIVDGNLCVERRVEGA